MLYEQIEWIKDGSYPLLNKHVLVYSPIDKIILSIAFSWDGEGKAPVFKQPFTKWWCYPNDITQSKEFAKEVNQLWLEYVWRETMKVEWTDFDKKLPEDGQKVMVSDGEHILVGKFLKDKREVQIDRNSFGDTKYWSCIHEVDLAKDK